MRYWFDTEETISAGCGFAHFGREHLLWLLVLAAFIALSCIVYRKLSPTSESSCGMPMPR